MKTLPAQELRPKAWKPLQDAVDALLWRLVFAPVVAVVKPALPKALRPRIAPAKLKDATPRELRNALDEEGAAALRAALASGAVQMIQDPTGRSAVFAVARPERRISDGLRAIGCRLNKTTGYWACEPAQVPAWVRAEAGGYAEKMGATHDLVKRTLDSIESNLEHAVDEAKFGAAADHAVAESVKNWQESAKALEVVPVFGAVGQAELSEQFARTRGIPIKSPGNVAMTDAVDLATKKAVKVWVQEALDRLRDEVDENAQAGYRAEGLAKRIRETYGVSKGRSELIARQETNNFMSAYRAAAAKNAGLPRYIWTGVGDARERKAHVDLNGRIFHWDDPPIIDPRTGQHGNPGDTYRCRCVGRPIIE